MFVNDVKYYSICECSQRQVTETVWVDKMTYYHYKSFYFKVYGDTYGCGNRLDRKPCFLSKFVQFPLDVVVDSTLLV
jgi:hypothetical protein